MDLSSEFYVDMILTLVGYLAAVGLGAIVYSTLSRRRTRDATAERPRTIQRPLAASPASGAPSPQFLNLSSRPAESSRSDRSAAKTTGVRGDDHRDRVDVIRLAREMLKAGADHKRIQQVLPVSEAELALLNLRNN